MLLIPGPVEVPFSVSNAGSLVINHRSDKFRDIVRENQELLNKFSGAFKSVVVTGSGTLAVETMVFSLINEGQRVLSISYGNFGERLIDSIKRKTKNVEYLNYDELNVENLIADISERDFDLLFLVHNETSNGTAINDLNRIIKIVKSKGSKLLIDGVSGFGGYNITMDGIYAMVTGSQKNIAAIPGTGIIFLSEEAYSDLMNNTSNVPFYLDLKTSLKFLNKNETAYTPSTGAFNSLNLALKILDREGFNNRIERIEKSSEFIRKKLMENDIKIFGSDDTYSNTVVCFYNGNQDLIKKLNLNNITVSKGMGNMAEKTIRLGTMGVINNFYIKKFLDTYFKVAGINENIDENEIPKETVLPEFILNDINLI